MKHAPLSDVAEKIYKTLFSFFWQVWEAVEVSYDLLGCNFALTTYKTTWHMNQKNIA
jgi:hypothetical protein